MAVGVAVRNDGQRVVISNQQYSLAFVGNATYTGVRKPLSYVGNPYGGGAAAIEGSGAPFMVYQIACVYPPVAFVQLTSSYFVFSSTQSIGTNLWEVVIGGPTFGGPIPIVKCFARLAGAGSGAGKVGMRVRDTLSPQSRCWDSTEKMLVLRQKIDWTPVSSGTSAALTQAQPVAAGIANPYLISCAGVGVNGLGYTSAGSQNTISVLSKAWCLLDGQVTRSSRAMRLLQFLDDTTTISNNLPADRCYIIDGDRY